MTKKTKETKKEEQVLITDKQFKDFKAEYEALVKKHGIGLVASLDVSQTGIVPKLSVAPYKE